jgi:hypothetical protein
LGDENPELRRCLFDHQFDVLILPYESRKCLFGVRPIEAFAQRLQCPVVLVGPVGGREVHLNQPAHLWLEELGLEDGQWAALSTADADAVA